MNITLPWQKSMHTYTPSSLSISILYFHFFKSCHFRKSLTITMTDISDESTSKKPKKTKTKTRKLPNFQAVYMTYTKFRNFNSTDSN